MDNDPIHWLSGSFYRRPEWRLLRAEYLLATGRRLDPRIDDKWVAPIRTVLRGRDGRESKVVAIRAAQDVWTGSPEVRGELEALLLTTLPLDVIANRRGLPVAVVEAYEATYFAVRAMRTATD
jgi:hypothetical protein